MGDYSLPGERAAVTIPTLVIAGAASFPFVRETARALADVLPDWRHRTLEGQEHNVDPAVLAPVPVEFFKDQNGTPWGSPAVLGRYRRVRKAYGFVIATNLEGVKERVLLQEGVGLDLRFVVARNAVATLFSYPGGEAKIAVQKR